MIAVMDLAVMDYNLHIHIVQSTCSHTLYTYIYYSHTLYTYTVVIRYSFCNQIIVFIIMHCISHTKVFVSITIVFIVVLCVAHTIVFVVLDYGLRIITWHTNIRVFFILAYPNI